MNCTLVVIVKVYIVIVVELHLVIIVELYMHMLIYDAYIYKCSYAYALIVDYD